MLVLQATSFVCVCCFHVFFHFFSSFVFFRLLLEHQRACGGAPLTHLTPHCGDTRSCKAVSRKLQYLVLVIIEVYTLPKASKTRSSKTQNICQGMEGSYTLSGSFDRKCLGSMPHNS